MRVCTFEAELICNGNSTVSFYYHIYFMPFLFRWLKNGDIVDRFSTALIRVKVFE